MEAGAPAIIGTWHNSTERTNWFEPTGCVTHTSLGSDGVEGSGGWFDRMIINASRSSSIYGASNTVTPLSLACLTCIKY